VYTSTMSEKKKEEKSQPSLQLPISTRRNRKQTKPLNIDHERHWVDEGKGKGKGRKRSTSKRRNKNGNEFSLKERFQQAYDAYATAKNKDEWLKSVRSIINDETYEPDTRQHQLSLFKTQMTTTYKKTMPVYIEESLTLPLEILAQIKQKKKEKVNVRKMNLLSVDASTILQYMWKMMISYASDGGKGERATKNRKFARIALPLLFFSGRRMSELLLPRDTFQEIENCGDYSIIFKSQLKERRFSINEAGQRESLMAMPYIIQLLIPPKIFLMYYEEMQLFLYAIWAEKKKQPIDLNKPEQINARFQQILGKQCKKITTVTSAKTPHQFRSLYAEVAYNMFGKVLAPDMTRLAYYSRQLGHVSEGATDAYLRFECKGEYKFTEWEQYMKNNPAPANLHPDPAADAEAKEENKEDEDEDAETENEDNDGPDDDGDYGIDMLVGKMARVTVSSLINNHSTPFHADFYTHARKLSELFKTDAETQALINGNVRNADQDMQLTSTQKISVYFSCVSSEQPLLALEMIRRFATRLAPSPKALFHLHCMFCVAGVFQTNESVNLLSKDCKSLQGKIAYVSPMFKEQKQPENEINVNTRTYNTIWNTILK
jgi:integrase